MYLRNCWYAAAWNHEVGSAPLARTLLDEPVVLFRTADGAPVALADRCCHRSLPLSMGRMTERGLQCGYHGLVFDGEGNCIEVPGQRAIPPDARVRAYPVIEKYQWIWIWMGDPDLADETMLPDWWRMEHPDWAVVKGDPPFYVRCNYELINDNLLDLSHLAFVHAGSIGTGAITDFPIDVERGDGSVRMTRWILDSPPPSMYQAFGGFTGNIDRVQTALSRLPSTNSVHAGCAVAGSGGPEGDFSQGIEFYNMNAMTPETETTTHYFYAHARSFALDSADVDETYRTDFREVFQEDVDILEAQQGSLDRDPSRTLIDINVDGPGLALRRMLREQIEREAQASPQARTA